MTYEQAIDEMVEILINQEDYSTLKQILRNYDTFVKKQVFNETNNTNINFELPYWCYGWCSNKSEDSK